MTTGLIEAQWTDLTPSERQAIRKLVQEPKAAYGKQKSEKH